MGLRIIDDPLRWLWTLLGLVLIPVLGGIEYYAGPNISFSSLYLVPVALTTWFGGRRLGLFAAVAAAAFWSSVDISIAPETQYGIAYVWNTASRLTVFIAFVLLLAALKQALRHEYYLARTDPVTGALNSRQFYELVENELSRAARYGHPFSAVYFDVDNFKTVNDRYGHTAGDAVLRTIADTVQRNLRDADEIARLGGDEFAILLPEADEQAARAATAKIQACLLDAMRKNQWPVTFSVGVLTCEVPPPTVEKMIELADALMYQAKSSGKNTVRYGVYDDLSAAHFA